MMSIALIIIAAAFACLTVALARRRHRPYLIGLGAVIVLILLFGAWQAAVEVTPDPDEGESRDALTAAAGQPTADILTPAP